MLLESRHGLVITVYYKLKCILSLKMFWRKYNRYTKKGEKIDLYKTRLKLKMAETVWKTKQEKDQWQQIEYSNKYGRY